MNNSAIFYCVIQLPTDGIRVFGNLLHTHLLGEG